MIPRVIHQIWFQGQEKMPQKYLTYQRNTIELHKEYRYVFWDGQRIERLIEKRYPSFYKIWMNLPYMIQKIDAAKIFILHRYGGVYIDADMEPIMNISKLLTQPLVFSRCYVHPLGIIGASFLGLKYFAKTQINNGFIACSRGHPVMRRAIEIMHTSAIMEQKGVYGAYIAKTCGTEVIVNALADELAKNPNLGFAVYPPEYFEPKVKIKDKEPLITKNTHVIHHTDRSWVKDSPIARTQMTMFIVTVIIISIVIITIIVLLTVWIIRRKKNKAFIYQAYIHNESWGSIFPVSTCLKAS
jgi:mannosyltransferase OCH1-like enzyme